MRLTDGLRVGSSKAIRECHGDLFAAHKVIGTILTIFRNNLEKNWNFAVFIRIWLTGPFF
jgi:hypothetical protein